jgi:CelD/BcsL family acetyltransferase involved in cellulose biosynthesis
VRALALSLRLFAKAGGDETGQKPLMTAQGGMLAGDAAATPVVAAPLRAPAGEVRAEILPFAQCQFAVAWDALATRAAEPNAFAERWYLEAAQAALDPKGDIQLACVWMGERLIGLMPLALHDRYAGLPIRSVQNWLNYNAFLGTPLLAVGEERLFWRTLLSHLDVSAKDALFLHLTGIALDGPIARALEEVCQATGRRHAIFQREERALLEHGLSPEAYLETNMRGKKRKELRRQHKRLSEEGALAFERSDGGDGLDRWIADFLELEQAGWKGANGSALACAPETQKLFRSALQGAAKAAKLELLTLRLDGRAIAMLANFLTPPGAFSFKTAFDEHYARFSPGVLLQVENLALLEREGIAWCDSCAAQDHPMIDSIWSGRRAIGRYSVAIGGPAKRAAFAALLTAEKAKAKFKGKAV